MENIKNNINMGLGDLATATFVRKFRFLLNLGNLDDQWVKKVKIDWVRKTLNFEVYEIYTKGKVPVLEWLKNPGKSGTFATYDGCGKALYGFKFDGLTITERWSDFDYAVSDESTMKVSMTFESYEQIDLGEEKIAEQEPKIMDYKKVTVEETDYKKLTVEEIEINRLNASTWLPGKVKNK